jgi:general secretion pathway protein I
MKTSGFSLLEILIALAIAAISLSILLRIFGGSLLISRNSEEFQEALVSLRSLENQLGTIIPLKEGQIKGEIDAGRQWRIDISPYLDDMVGRTADDANGFIPMWVEIEVDWGDPLDPRALSVKTLRLAPVKQGVGRP